MRFIIAITVSLSLMYLGLAFIEYDFAFSLADYTNEIRLYILLCFLVVLYIINGMMYYIIDWDWDWGHLFVLL